jgi:hypothetical protein
MSTDSHTHNDVQSTPAPGTRPAMATDTHRHLAMLRILYGACVTALEAFRAADNPVDDQLVVDLETMVERTKGEIERLTAHLAKPAS